MNFGRLGLFLGLLLGFAESGASNEINAKRQVGVEDNLIEQKLTLKKKVAIGQLSQV